jgi:archaellum component FlaC
LEVNINNMPMNIERYRDILGNNIHCNISTRPDVGSDLFLRQAVPGIDRTSYLEHNNTWSLGVLARKYRLDAIEPLTKIFSALNNISQDNCLSSSNGSGTVYNKELHAKQSAQSIHDFDSDVGNQISRVDESSSPLHKEIQNSNSLRIHASINQPDPPLIVMEEVIPSWQQHLDLKPTSDLPLHLNFHSYYTSTMRHLTRIVAEFLLDESPALSNEFQPCQTVDSAYQLSNSLYLTSKIEQEIELEANSLYSNEDFIPISSLMKFDTSSSNIDDIESQVEDTYYDRFDQLAKGTEESNTTRNEEKNVRLSISSYFITSSSHRNTCSHPFQSPHIDLITCSIHPSSILQCLPRRFDHLYPDVTRAFGMIKVQVSDYHAENSLSFESNL